jgi:uncharacterized protein
MHDGQFGRRRFLKSGALVSLGFIGLSNFAVRAGSSVFADDVYGFGPITDNDDGILRLPKDFKAKLISQNGKPMHGGLVVPGTYDGMGAFDIKNGKVLLIRNHELSPGAADGPFGKDYQLISKVERSSIYDFGAGKSTCVGGTTSIIYDERQQNVELEYLSLVGTVRNCAGGITPWNTWITCEETDLKTGGNEGDLEKDHGYNFEVIATTSPALQDPVPLKAMGRFVHEAVAVHPNSGIIYQTEDSGDGVFYRFLPNEHDRPAAGGRLQCLALHEWKSADTRNWEMEPGTAFPLKKTFTVYWIDVDNVEAPDNDLRIRAYDKGAARFARAEGIWYGKNELFFACTNGGRNTAGQIFRYIPSNFEGTDKEKTSPAKLELFLEPNNTDIFHYCDNLTIAPWGDVIICEDKNDPRIIGITPEGNTYVIAQNIGYPKSEFAGPVFSPSGSTLFVNIQSPGVTLAITGPWGKNKPI